MCKVDIRFWSSSKVLSSYLHVYVCVCVRQEKGEQNMYGFPNEGVQMCKVNIGF